ncbi:MAG: TRAP transporter substrate-binding protein DctP [Rhodospirillaceae bacterium]|nr:TRAP transporter substrate-binding protein DctP [Rhodospirillales bacterium]
MIRPWAAALAFCTFAFASANAAEPPRVIHLAHTQMQDPSQDTAAAMAAEFKREVERRTDGTVTVAIFPEAQLGGNRDLGKLVAAGTIQSALVTVGGLAPHYPLIAAIQMPFALDSAASAARVFDGPFGLALAADIEKRAGITVLGFGDSGGFHILTNSRRPIHRPKDVAGLKLRTIPGLDTLDAMIKGMGGVPVKTSSREELTALATGILDGQMNPAPVIVTRRYDEVQKYATLTNHLYAPYVWLFNAASLASLSPDQQSAVRASASQAIASGRTAAKTLETSARGLPTLRRRMEVVELSPAERAEFRAATQPPVAAAIARSLGDDGTRLLTAFQAAAKGRKLP